MNRAVLSLFAFGLMLACSRPSEEKTVGATAPTNPVADEKLSPTLQSIQTGFIDKKCISCHSQPAEKNRFVVLVDLSQVIEGAGHEHEHGGIRKLIKPGCPKESFLLSILRKGNMPPDAATKISDETVKVVEDWIAGLRPIGSTCSDEPPDLTDP